MDREERSSMIEMTEAENDTAAKGATFLQSVYEPVFTTGG